jgi:beta-N-acetylhexosaminidase
VIHHRRSSLGAGGVGLRRRRVGTAIALLGATSLIGACAGTTSSDVTAVGVQDPVSTNSAPSTTSSGGTDAASIDLDPLKPCLDTLSVEEKAGQVLWVMTATPANVADSAKAGKIGGVGALEDQGGDIAGQITAVTADTKVPMTVASDEEGGTVQRLDKVIEPLPSARDTTGTLSTAQTKAMWTKYSTSMAGLGFTANFAPVLDVGFGVALKSRSYALDPQVVVDFALAAADGMTEGGIKPIAKHFPGIGYATADPHGELVRVSSLNELKQREFLPFKAAIDAGIPAIMTTHAVIPDVTNGEPVTMSPEGIALLRDDLGFKGLIVTDSLIMGAIADQRTQSQAAVQALVAGNDVALIAGAQNVDEVHTALVAAVADGTISEKRLNESVKRVLDFKGVKGPCSKGGAQPTTSGDAQTSTSAASGTTVLERDPVGGGQPADQG